LAEEGRHKLILRSAKGWEQLMCTLQTLRSTLLIGSAAECVFAFICDE
jgi:hypothetical protein